MGHLKSFQSNQLQGRETTMVQNNVEPVLIKKQENVITLSAPGGGPLHHSLINRLTHDLSYSHVEQLHGKSYVNPVTGKRVFY